MERHLNLVESDFEQLEKRILPRFPFCYLTFKGPEEKVFEVKDISHSGMQLCLKNGDHNFKADDQISGNLHWSGQELEVTGVIRWQKPNRLGVEFSGQTSLRGAVEDFLAIDGLARHLKPIHKLDYGIDFPPRLKYWFRADGPVEIFIWRHGDGELSSFQVLIMENFVEWEDGKGLLTARVMSKRDIDTPLITEDEFVFKVDPYLDDKKIARAIDLVESSDHEMMSQDVLDFIKLKLRN